MPLRVTQHPSGSTIHRLVYPDGCDRIRDSKERWISLDSIPRPEYPRPQLVRDRWTNLNGEWHFAFDDEDVGLEERWQEVTPERLAGSSPFDRRIVVPYCYQSKLSGIGDTAFHDVVWYARTFAAERAPDEATILHFGAVDYRATVWVNGLEVARHEGGHTPFEADVTHALRDGENVLVVRAEDPSEDLTIPRGKQYWKELSESIFYTRTTGIWQTVWLEPMHRVHIASLRITPDVDSGSVLVEVGLSRQEQGLRLRARISREMATVVDDLVSVRSGRVTRRFPLGSARERSALWSPEHPNLYDLHLEVVRPDGTVVDAVDSYFGMRKVEARGGRVYLNNRPYYQRLVLDQGYFPEGILTAPSAEDLRRDIELAKEMGFNGARKHQKVEDPQYLYLADTLGFLVWGEMANAYEFSEEYVARIAREWQEAVRRDYNHPCIVAWVPVNESWGVPGLGTDRRQVEHLLAMYHLTRSLDQTRLVVSNDGWEHALTDLCTIHDYRDAPALVRDYATPESSVAAEPAARPIYCAGFGYRGEPILITEFGGIAFQADRERGWGYSTVADSEELLRRYEALIGAILSSETVQGFCYTQLTDVEQEVNGLLTYDRRPKADLARIRGITTRQA